jgi:hypothetical protein
VKGAAGCSPPRSKVRPSRYAGQGWLGIASVATAPAGCRSGRLANDLYVLPRDSADHGVTDDGDDQPIGGRHAAMAHGADRWSPAARCSRCRADRSDRQDRRPDRRPWRLRSRSGGGAATAERLRRSVPAVCVWYDGTSTFSGGGGAWPPELAGHPATPPTARPTACMRARPLGAVCARRWARRLGLA